MQTIDKEALRAALDVVRAMADVIRELKSVPAGQLYGSVCGSMSLEQFERVIGMLVNAGLVRRDASHLLTWIEPINA